MEVLSWERADKYRPDIVIYSVRDSFTPEQLMDQPVFAGLEAAHEMGLLTIALAGGSGGPVAASSAVDHLLVVASGDPRVVKELQVTTYHVLWELVHVFFEQPGVLDPEVVR